MSCSKLRLIWLLLIWIALLVSTSFISVLFIFILRIKDVSNFFIKPMVIVKHSSTSLFLVLNHSICCLSLSCECLLYLIFSCWCQGVNLFIGESHHFIIVTLIPEHPSLLLFCNLIKWILICVELLLVLLEFIRTWIQVYRQLNGISWSLNQV